MSLDPLLAQSISLLAGAIAMAIVSIVSYYFPRGRDRFDEEPEKKPKTINKEEEDEA